MDPVGYVSCFSWFGECSYVFLRERERDIYIYIYIYIYTRWLPLTCTMALTEMKLLTENGAAGEEYVFFTDIGS